MATNNFLPWGDNAGNIMDGADYEASNQRTDGVELGLADPALHNKLYRQVTLMAAALGQVIADNGLDASDSNMAGLVQAIKQVFLSVVPVDKGGTGATEAAGARENLGITPANIGALPTSGGTMGGDIEFGQTLHNVGWSYTDGRAWQVRPDPDLDLFQIVRRTTGGQYIGYLEVTKDGDLLIHNPLGVTEGGTGAEDALTAAINLGLSDPDPTDIEATDAEDWTTKIRARILERAQDRRCMVVNAGWQNNGLGSALAWWCAGNLFVLIFNWNAFQPQGLKFWIYVPSNSEWYDIGIG